MTAPATTPVRRRPSRGRIAALAVGAVLVLAAIATVSVWFSPIGERYREAAVEAPPLVGTTEVDLVDSRFTPASIAVPTGTTVTWHWTDGEDHDVWFTDGTGTAVRGTGTWSRTFTEPGEYRYTCRLHLFMDGRVVVE